MVNMKRPVMLGVALTNRPHVRLKKHPISVVEKDGEKLVRVPFMVKGKYHHPQGDLDFTDDAFDKMLENYRNGVADYDLAADSKHQPERGAWMWFQEELGGKVVRENVNGEDLLVGYAKPADESVIRDLSGVAPKFRYASLEFHPNYRSNVKQTYLSEDLTDWEDSMENITLFNPYHGKGGLFASKAGGVASGVAKGSAKRKKRDVKNAVKAAKATAGLANKVAAKSRAFGKGVAKNAVKTNVGAAKIAGKVLKKGNDNYKARNASNKAVRGKVINAAKNVAGKANTLRGKVDAKTGKPIRSAVKAVAKNTIGQSQVQKDKRAAKIATAKKVGGGVKDVAKGSTKSFRKDFKAGESDAKTGKRTVKNYSDAATIGYGVGKAKKAVGKAKAAITSTKAKNAAKNALFKTNIGSTVDKFKKKKK